jgi:hypothetical protein
MGNQLFALAMRRPSSTTLGQSSMGNGTALPGMIFLAMRTEPVSSPISGDSTFFCGASFGSGKLCGFCPAAL